jgi:hypothetical protein
MKFYALVDPSAQSKCYPGWTDAGNGCYKVKIFKTSFFK